MTVRRLHFKITLPAQPSPNRRKNERAARTLMAAIALAGLAWAFSGFSVSPSELDFGGQSVGQNNVLEIVEIVNRSSAAVEPQLRVEGESASDFQYERSACAGIEAGASCRLPVQFVPHEPGKKLATMVIRLGSQEPRTVALRGVAFRAGVTLAPGKLDFDDVYVGSSASSSVTMHGEGWFHIHSVSVEGPGEADFTTDSPPCISESATPKDCLINIEFKPRSPGELTATLVINDDAAGSPHRVALRGNGIPVNPPPTPTPLPPPPPPAPNAVISPPSLDFSQNHNAAQQVHVLNQGNAPLAVSLIEIAGDDADSFRADKQSCPEIVPGSECVIDVSYRGKWFGKKKTAYAAELRVHDNDANQSAVQTVALRLTENAASARLSVNPASLTLSGTVTPGKPETLTWTITVRNDGPGDIKTFLVYLEPFNKDGRFFSYKSGCTKLAEGNTCDIYVTFTGTQAREYKNTLYISGEGTKQISVPLDATLAPGGDIIQ